VPKRYIGCLLLVLLSLSCVAQDDDSDDDDGPPSASLFVKFDRYGSAKVDFTLAQPPKSWNGIREALAQALHCPAANFVVPPASNQAPRATEWMSRWTPEQRAAYEKALAQYNQRRVTATCPAAMQHTALVYETTLNDSALVITLRPEGVQQLWLNVQYPATKEIEYSRDHLLRDSGGANHYLVYGIPVWEPAVPLHFSFGFPRADLERSFAIMAGFILAPLLFTLWVMRAALRAGKEDPTAAWFSYFRTMNWSLNGAMLLWVTSGLGARQTLQDWSAFTTTSEWWSALLGAVVVIGPAFTVYFLCIAVSYPLHVQLRGATWTRREFFQQQLAQVGAQVLPLMFLLGAIGTMTTSFHTSMVLLAFTYVSWLVCQNLRLRLTKSYPQALTTGELRDRVFELAKRAGVEVNQIFILPTGKGQIANAFASKSRIVMFTDYLLQHLTKREVDGVAAHEVMHLQRHHVGKRVVAFYCALMLPAILGGFFEGAFRGTLRALQVRTPALAQAYAAMAWFWQWSQRDFVLILAGLAGFYFLSRRFEHAADEGAVQLTGDAEAQITGLLKLSRLNLMPIQWGKGTESWLTHPSTVRRAERIAAHAGMSAEQLQSILDRYRAEAHLPAVSNSRADGEFYDLPQNSSAETVRSAAKKRRSHQLRLWTALLGHVLPPALVVLLVRFTHVQGSIALALYFAGAILTTALCLIVGLWLSVARRTAQRSEVASRLKDFQLQASDTMVGFSPGAVARFYGLNYYNWDIGFLRLEKGQLVFVGEQVGFSVQCEQIDGICVGQGGPSWFKFPRVYIRWNDSNGRPAVFNIACLEPCGMRQIRSQAYGLYERVRRWKSGEGVYSASSTKAPPLAMGAVTSRSPRDLGSMKTNLRVLIYLIPPALITNAVLGLDAISYLISVILLARLVQSIPYWRYRDRLLSFATQSRPEVGIAAKASESGA
jgi:Zn-dependent protease with chaperone function